MNWTCPNCGKRVALSQEQLAETRGVVVCPQCLSSDKVKGFDTPTKAKQSAAARTRAATPPPRKPRLAPPPHKTSAPAAAPTDTGSASRSAGKPVRKKKKKPAQQGCLQPMSATGCLWRTVLLTLLLLLAYVVVGFLLQGI